ncbi:MAG: hypothetical protein AAFZ09_06220, partial [Pseudomonadota bacterium]
DRSRAHVAAAVAGLPRVLDVGDGMRGHLSDHQGVETLDLNDIDAEDEGERRVFGLVLTNGGKRTVMDLPVGLAGAQPRRMRIIGMPAIHGSGRWGDSLTAMPGRIAEGDTGSATVSYTWFRNGQPIEGETDFRLRLVPSVAALGDAISVSVAWSDGATQESWETPAVTVKTWKHVDDGGVIRFGALTPAGLFGVPVATDEVTITSGNGAGHWELRTGGGVAFLRPTAGPSTPGSDPVTSGESVISGTYTLGLSNGDTLTVTVIPGVYTALLKRDIEVLAQDLGAPAGSGQYAFDFSSGGRIELWNSGIWGHVDDPASAGTRITGLVLNGSDADGGPGALVVASYDAAEPTVVTGPVHIAEARNRAEEMVANRRGELERELTLVVNRRALLEKQQSNALEKQTELRYAIDRAPEVEMELNALQRQYGGVERRYRDTVSKLAVAETGEELEVNRQAERFEVIEQASKPGKPIAPNRRLIAASGFAGGFAAAFALIIFAELMNQSVRTASDLERTLNLRPVVTIPYIETEQEVRRRVWRLRVGVLLVLVVVPSTLYAVDQFVQPLELLVENALERSGAMRFIEMARERLS